MDLKGNTIRRVLSHSGVDEGCYSILCCVVCLLLCKHNGGDLFLDSIILYVKKASIARDLCFVLFVLGCVANIFSIRKQPQCPIEKSLILYC